MRTEHNCLPSRILLCVPRGGMNDTLCQIEKCRVYAKKYSRALIIDSRRSGLRVPFAQLFLYLDPNENIDLDLAAVDYDHLNTLLCWPSVVQGNIGQYDVSWGAHIRNYVETNSSVRLTFNFEKDYSSPLLVHEQCGGGDDSQVILTKLKIAPEIMLYLNARIAELPKTYIAVHVRNTDLKTNYIGYFETINSKLLGKNVLICSDDLNVAKFAKKYLVQSNVFTVTNSPNRKETLDNITTPNSDSNSEMKVATMDALTDLIALAQSKRLFFSNTESGGTSGFSRMASFLWRNPKIIASLLGD